MKPISEQRRILELERRERFFMRTTRHKVHFENVSWIYRLTGLILKSSFFYRQGLRNAQNVRVKEQRLEFVSLPEKFDGLRILFISDLHIDAVDLLTENIISATDSLEYDFCILGGDYRFLRHSNSDMVEPRLTKLVKQLKGKSRVLAVLGNHDEYHIAEFLDQLGVEMLINEAVCMEKNGQRIYLVGTDDCHYYDTADISEACSKIEQGQFKILICHSPELYVESERAGFSFYLTGHTHGGQICLPGGIAVFSRASVPRRLVKGVWRYGKMTGYTSCGAGSSGVPARFFCPPEVTLITLKRQQSES
ncbi:MAG: metallophosphoesterase [Planctomycetota bacterium]